MQRWCLCVGYGDAFLLGGGVLNIKDFDLLGYGWDWWYSRPSLIYMGLSGEALARRCNS